MTKLFKLLGLAATDVYSDVHAVAARGTAAANEPVTVRSAAGVASGYVIPLAPASEDAAPESKVVLDMKRVDDTLAQTSAVASLLADIFTDEDTTAPVPPSTSPTVAGLDAAHANLAQTLARRDRWTRNEVEDLAATLGLLPDGAIDTINEAALDRCDESLCEGDDPIEINPRVAKELLK